MKQTDVSDSELVSRVLAGDGQAYAVLVGRYTNALSSIAFLKVRNAEDARDVVQEAFVIAYCSLGQLDEPSSFGAWVRGIALNCCRKLFDRRTRTQRFLERLPCTVEVPDPGSELAAREDARQVLRALDVLSETHREVVMLYYFQEMKIDGIARLVDRPAGTVKRVLSEARGRLREELVELAREEFREYQLSDEQRRRLEMIPVFPREEPKVTVSRLREAAEPITILAPRGNFPELRVGAEAYYADYDHPSHKLSRITHVKVEGPFDIGGKQALRYDDLSFTQDGRVDGIWRPYYCVEGGTALYCAKQSSGWSSSLPLIVHDQPEWDEPKSKPESLRLVPGSVKEPDADQSGRIVDGNLWEVSIGRRSFQCVRRIGGADRQPVEWSDKPLTICATEEFFLADGRLLLWRRYNGLRWSERNPGRKPDAPGTYERLAEAGVPMLDIFGERYYLWYDQIPSYAVG